LPDGNVLEYVSDPFISTGLQQKVRFGS